MNEIATDFDKLFGATLAALYRDKINAYLMKDVFLAIKNQVNSIPNPSREIMQAKANLEFYSKQFQEDEISLVHFVDAATMQEDWDARSNSFSPDFQIFFSPKLSRGGIDLKHEAGNDLNRKYNPLGSGPNLDSKDLKTLLEKGLAFQTTMRRES